MATVLLKFVFVVVVVMVGFAMALHVLFRGRDSFGETFLGLFNAMLGDTDFFDEFSGERYDSVATVLLVTYLFVVTIMLLNLLVAILSTAHTRDTVKGEFKASKARIIQHYRFVVDEDLLPAPFNVVQLVGDLVARRVYAVESTLHELEMRYPEISLQWGFLECCLACCVSIFVMFCRVPVLFCDRLSYGPLMFCLVLGPVAVVGGTLLWGMSSVPYAQYAWYTQYNQDREKNWGAVPR